VRRGKERYGRVLGTDRQRGGAHVDVGHYTLMRYQSHLRFAGRAGRQIQDGWIRRPDALPQTFSQAGILSQRHTAYRPQSLERHGSLGFTSEQNPVSDWSAPQGLPSSRTFDEGRSRTGIAERHDQVRRRVIRVHGGGHRSVLQDPQIREVELQPRLRVQRDDVALLDSQDPKSGGNFIGRPPVFVPGISPIPAVRCRLAQSGRIAVLPRGLFENLTNGSLRHSCNVTWGVLGEGFQKASLFAGCERMPYAACLVSDDERLCETVLTLAFPGLHWLRASTHRSSLFRSELDPRGKLR